MALCMHGTTQSRNFFEINFNSFKRDSCWNCSESDNKVYVWSLEALETQDPDLYDMVSFQKSYTLGNYPDLVQHAPELFRFAQDSALIQAAHEGVDNQVILYLLDVPEEHLEADDSCENMTSARRFDPVNFQFSWIKAVYSHPFKGFWSPFIVARQVANEYFNASTCSEDLLVLAKKIYQADLHIDLEELDYKIYEMSVCAAQFSFSNSLPA